MSKKQEYSKVVLPMLEQNELDDLKQYVLTNANLPGRMGNITLVHVIASILDGNKHLSEACFPIFKDWWKIEADGNDAETVAALVALESFGAMYKNTTEKQQEEINALLINALNDERWRMREIVTESYKWIGKSAYDELIKLFSHIIEHDPTPLEIRGILGTVAHPELLKTEQQLDFSQKVMEISFNYYLTFDLKRFTKEDKTILKKGLSFAPSVIVSKNPKEGFNFLNSLIEKEDKGLKTIIKENLKKKRLSSLYSNDVERLLKKLA